MIPAITKIARPEEVTIFRIIEITFKVSLVPERALSEKFFVIKIIFITGLTDISKKSKWTRLPTIDVWNRSGILINNQVSHIHNKNE